MPENEFEKKVSSEMQELKFNPSQKVWLRVEERIRKKNKRRVFIIIFFLAGLALLGYWQRNNLFGGKGTEIVTTEKQNENNFKPSEETKNNPSTSKQNAETTKQEEPKNTNDKTVNNKTTVTKSLIDKKDIEVSKNEIRRPKDNKKNGTKITPSPKENKLEENPKVSNDMASENSQKQTPNINDVKAKDTFVVNTNPETIIKRDEIKTTGVKPVENKTDSSKADISDKEKIITRKTDTVLKAEPAKEPSVPIARIDTSGKKWKWGLHLTTGISSLNNNSISFGEQKSAGNLNYQSSVGSGTSAAPPRQGPSDIKPGFAFEAGVFAQRILSSRTSLSLGLQYAYYSNRLGIGRRIDSLPINNRFSNTLDGNQDHVYNAGGDTVKFTNRYHFIELPLRFQWQLNKGKTNPFVWSTGLTIGQLVASNAIMYDTAFNGIYYRNKGQVNKTQFSLSTGFSWTLANDTRTQWSIGPVANIHLNRLVDNPFENKKYLFFVGLRAAVLFNQRK
jgi:hypothetical protein